MSICKGCTHSVIVSKEVLQELIQDAEKDGRKIVSEDVFEKRLNMCKSCPSLQYETTCMHSGSLIHYRARLKESTCPYPQGSKWLGA
ncbi:DUF6171 family protein [Lederbergia wuyishanensis]|uniref:Uncharacterized protein n=1 Tax=Lederbergia wuyishanensis TaxID=1347903 RepID=A0ABU0D9E3_9BACI|nr:DUF6171 family protein [Lederbergia wuyishanensis]MCJ8007514.1 DUF6171 family protein [Lederbergia wuyishanensis]MDQ0345046.1 hypothetical protein [Lederbergia wuyishanensis]